MRGAGLDVDVRLGLVTRRAARRGARRVGAGRSAARPRSPPRCSPPADELVVVGRAGIGLDNVDVAGRDAARRDGRERAAVERAVGGRAHDGAAARAGPQHPAGRPRPRRRAVEPRRGGRASSCTARRSASSASVASACSSRSARHAFGMRLVAYDPFVSADRARQLGVDLVPTLDELVATCRLPDHPPAQDARDHRPHLAPTCSRRPSRRCASSTPPAAGSSTRPRSPTRCATAGSPAPRSTCSPRSPRPSRRCSSSTTSSSRRTSARRPPRRRTRPGQTIAEQVVLALRGDFVPFAVNVAATEAIETVRPFLPLAERLGRLFTALAGRRRRHARGQLRGRDRRLRLPGAHAVGAEGRARPGRRRAGVVRERAAARRGARARRARDDVVVGARLREPGRAARSRGERSTHVAGTLFGKQDAPAHRRHRRPQRRRAAGEPHARRAQRRHARDDRHASRTIVGDAGINIDDMDVGTGPGGRGGADGAVAPSTPVPPEVVDASSRATDGVVDATRDRARLTRPPSLRLPRGSALRQRCGGRRLRRLRAGGSSGRRSCGRSSRRRARGRCRSRASPSPDGGPGRRRRRRHRPSGRRVGVDRRGCGRERERLRLPRRRCRVAPTARRARARPRTPTPASTPSAEESVAPTCASRRFSRAASAPDRPCVIDSGAASGSIVGP